MKACLFDIDGTLIQTGGAGQWAFAKTFREEFGIEQISQDVPFAGRSDRAIAGDLLLAHGQGNDDATWQRFQTAYHPNLDLALEACEGRVLPGVAPLIKQLVERGDIAIGLLTGNVVAGAERKLTYYGLWDHFPFGGFGDTHPNRNDIAADAVAQARQHYPRLASANGATSDCIVVIGDTIHDIHCAHSVGAKAVGVPTGFTPADELSAESPELVVDTLEDCETLLSWFDC